MITIRIFSLILLALSACNFTSSEITPQPTATTIRVVPSTLVPTLARQAQIVPSVVVEATNTPQPISTDCQLSAGLPALQHTVVANVNYAQHGLIANQHIHYINRGNDSLDTILINAEANQWLDALEVEKVEAGGEPVTYELTGRWLTVELSSPLEPGCSVEMDITFRLTVPQIGAGISGYKGYLGYTPRQLNLSNWLLTVAPRLDGEWLKREASLVGEQTVFEVADWDVTLNISGATDALEIAGPGEVTQPSPTQWQFILQNSRDFSLSLSEEFIVDRVQAANGVEIELFTFADSQVVGQDGAVLDGASHALDVASKSMAMYSDLFGPYPHSRMAVVEGDFPDGMEFSGIVFVSQDWFKRWPGSAASYLTIITVHEVAHQWWYAGVGSDQAMAPWLDESLATYSEYIFYEEYYPELKDWWWSFRVDAYSPQGFVDSSVYEFASIREYINAVYLRGAHMLHDIRGELGTDAFFELLNAYATTGQGRIVSADLLFSLMTTEQLQLTQATRQRYLRQPGLAG